MRRLPALKQPPNHIDPPTCSVGSTATEPSAASWSADSEAAYCAVAGRTPTHLNTCGQGCKAGQGTQVRAARQEQWHTWSAAADRQAGRTAVGSAPNSPLPHLQRTRSASKRRPLSVTSVAAAGGPSASPPQSLHSRADRRQARLLALATAAAGGSAAPAGSALLPAPAPPQAAPRPPDALPGHHLHAVPRQPVGGKGPGLGPHALHQAAARQQRDLPGRDVSRRRRREGMVGRATSGTARPLPQASAQRWHWRRHRQRQRPAAAAAPQALC